jgi:hypothetical protein
MDMDPRTKGQLKPAYYVDTADEVYFTYSITNDSSSVIFPIDIAGQLKLMLWLEAKLLCLLYNRPGKRRIAE